MDRIIIDLTGIDSRVEFWRQVRIAFDCPEYFGDNIDAFRDVLSEIVTPTELVFVNTEVFRNAMPEYFEALDEMLTDMVIESEDIYVSYED